MLLFVKEALCKNDDIMSMYDLISGMVYIEFHGLEENKISSKGITRCQLDIDILPTVLSSVFRLFS